MAFENNDSRYERSAIARRKLTFTTIVSEDTKAVAIPVNGKLLNYSITAPNLDTDTTFDLSINHEDGQTIYTNSGISDNTTTVVLMSDKPVPMAGVMTFTVSFTTAQVATFNLYIYYE